MTSPQPYLNLEGDQRFGFRRVCYQFIFHGKGLVERPLNVQIVFIVGIVGRTAWLDEHRLYIVVQVKEHHRVPFGNQLYGCTSFRLGLSKKIAVEINALTISASAQNPSIGVLDNVDQENHIF